MIVDSPDLAEPQNLVEKPLFPIRGDLLLADVTFHQSPGGKLRPVIVALDIGDSDVVVLPVTSKSARDRFDCELLYWAEAGLDLASVA